MKRYFLTALFITLISTSKAQNFPLGLVPLSNPMQVSFKHPIKYLSTNRFTGKEEKTYTYENNVVLDGISFRILFLIFRQDKLTTLRLGIRNKADCDAIIKSLKSKYKKSSLSSSPYCYQNGNIEICVLIEGEPKDAHSNYAYLCYDYGSSGEL